jgi:hypothetical protein
MILADSRGFPAHCDSAWRVKESRVMTTLAVRALGVLIIALLLLGVAAALPAPAEAQLNVTGQWSTLPYLMPVNPIHATLLKNGKVLIVGGSENNPTATVFKTAVWDPIAGTFATQLTPWDLFCNGMSFLPDGRVIITGGNFNVVDPFPGPPWTTIFDPATEKFYRVEDMAKGRWYPSNTALSDGGTMVFGGLDEQSLKNNTVEIYDVGGGWSPPYQANWSTGWYPRMHLLGNGKVFVGAPNPDSHTFEPATGTWSSSGATTKYGQDRQYGSSVLRPLDINDGYRPRVVIFGGTTTGNATNTVEMIDLGAWPEAWVSMPSMSVPRVHANAVLLPNGKILVLGGSTVHLDLSTAHLGAATFDPVAQTWTSSGTMAYPRIYHHSALLLPDGTVYVGGSNPGRQVWEPHVEIYKPPYLFTSSGAPAPRPTISLLPAVVGYGQPFTVTMPDATIISDVVLMRPGANTHAFDQEQRLIHMQFTQTGATLSVTSPLSPGGPPGYYMLFILNAQNVPSVAKFIQLTPNPTNQPPTATIANPTGNVSIAAGQSVTFAGTASDPDGSIALYSWNFPGGSPKKSNAQNPGAVTFSTPGVYTVSLTVLDDLGANNPSPPTVTITVGGTAALGASITSPVSGSTVSGTVTVNMAASNAQGSPTQFLLKLDNATTLSNQSVTGSTATYAWNTSGLSGTHTLNLTVTDSAARTATAMVTVTVGSGGPDTTPPTVTLTAPANGATVSGAAVTVSATASDTVGVVGVQFKLDGANLGAEDTTALYSVSWNTTTVGDGPHTLTAVARDAAGNTTTSAPVTVTVANGGPPPGPGPQPVVWTSLVKVTASGNTITKNAGCSGCGDAGAVSQQTIAAGDGYVEFTMSAGADGTAGLSSGNPGVTGAEIKFGLRSTGGYVEVRESGVYKSDWPIVAGAVYRVAVEGSVVKYYQNGMSKYTSAVAPTYPLLLDTSVNTMGGAVQNAVIASGAGGGGGPDTTPPTVTVTAPASGTTVSGTVTVSATASDNVGVVGVQFKLAGVNLGAEDTTAPYATTWDTTTATAGTHTLTAVARDAAGNTTISAPVTVTVGSGGPPPGPGPQPVVWTSTVNVAVSGNTITKNAGCDGCYDAGAISQQTIASGDGYVEFTISTGAYVTVGLSTGNTGTGANEITFGLKFYSGSPSFVEVRESGVYKWDWAAVAGAVYRIAVEGGVVKYSQNGVLKYTSAVAPTYPLLLDAALGSVGGAVQSAVISGGDGGGGGDTTAPTVTLTAPADGATVSGTVTVSATASDNVSVVGIQFKLDGANLGAEDTAAPYAITWDTTTATAGTHTLTAVARDAAGNTTISAPVTVTVGSGGPPPGPGPQPVVWTSLVNVTASGNTITKSGGCNGCWDAGAISQQTIAAGDGSVEFTIPAGTGATVGLSTGNPGTSGNDITFGLRFTPGSPGFVEVRESGVYKADWLQVAGAVHKVAVEGGVVKYSQNGVLKYTSALAPTSPLVVDATLDSIGNAVQNAIISTP